MMHCKIVYDKSKTLHALRYHFLARQDIRILLISVNVFAIIAVILYVMKRIGPMPFLTSSVLWMVLMVSFWILLPRIVFEKNKTFHDTIDLELRESDLLLETDKGSVIWAYEKFKYFLETPDFFHLYLNEKSFFLLPKSACKDTSEVRHVLDKKIGRK